MAGTQDRLRNRLANVPPHHPCAWFPGAAFRHCGDDRFADDQGIYHGLSDSWAYINNSSATSGLTQVNNGSIPVLVQRCTTEVINLGVAAANAGNTIFAGPHYGSITWQGIGIIQYASTGNYTGAITLSSGVVSQWSDKSGNGKHATQGTASARPDSGTRTIGGKNIIVFPNTSSQSLFIPSINVVGGKRHEMAFEPTFQCPHTTTGCAVTFPKLWRSLTNDDAIHQNPQGGENPPGPHAAILVCHRDDSGKRFFPRRRNQPLQRVVHRGR